MGRVGTGWQQGWHELRSMHGRMSEECGTSVGEDKDHHQTGGGERGFREEGRKQRKRE